MHDELLRAVLARPDDNEVRLVYADALQRDGDPYGEFIALQIAKPSDPQVKQLLDSHRDEWTARLGVGVSDVHWVRGFAESARIRVTSDVSALFDRAPIRDLGFTLDDADEEPDLTDHAARLADDPRLARLRLLATNVYWNRPLARLLASPYLANLKALHIGDADCHLYTVEAIVAASFPQLEVLTFAGDWMGDLADEGSALLARAKLPALRDLALLNLDVGPLGMRAISRSGWPLRNLDLGWGSYTPNHVGPDGAAAINEMKTLERVTLDHNEILDAGAAALTDLPELRVLSVKSNGIGDAGLAALGQAKLPKLETLELTFNRPLTGAGVAAFTTSPTFARLHTLWLRQIPLGPEVARALASTPNQLRNLNLLECKIGDEGARALLESPHLEHLEELQLNGNKISYDVSAALTARFGERVHVNR